MNVLAFNNSNSNSKFNQDEKEEIVLKFPIKQITIKISINLNDSVLQVRRIVENILGIDMSHTFDIYIKNLCVGSIFDRISLIYLLDEFSTREIGIQKKININENNIFDIENTQQELKDKPKLLLYLEQNENELKTSLDDLKLLEKNLRKEYEILKLKKKENINLTVTSFLNLNKNSDESDETEVTINSKERIFNKFIDEFNQVLFKKEDQLKERTDKLIQYKRLEKTSFKICKSNEILANKSDLIEQDREAKLKLIDKLKEKEMKLYDIISKDSSMIYKYMKDKNKMDNNYYFQKIKMQFARVSKSKINIKLIDEKRVLIFKIDYKNPTESELLYRKFKDKCEFSILFNDLVGKRNELQLNYKKKLFIISNKDSCVYDFKKNEMRSLSLFPLEDYHTNGNLIYMPYDNSLYVISGRSSELIEKLKLPNLKEKFYNLKQNWTRVCGLEYELTHFCSFVINKKVLYIILGYDFNKKTHSTDIFKLDVSQTFPQLITIKITDKNSPKLTFSACIKFMDSRVYILGGMYNEREKNPNVFIFDTINNNFHKTEFMIRPNYELYENLEFNLNLNSMASTNFTQESIFLPCKYDSKFEENAFFYSIFDNSSFLHMINVKTFRHFMICQDNKDVIWDESSEDEVDSIYSKNTKKEKSKSYISEKISKNNSVVINNLEEINFKRSSQKSNISSIKQSNSHNDKNFSNSSNGEIIINNNEIDYNYDKYLLIIEDDFMNIYNEKIPEVIDDLDSDFIVENEGEIYKSINF